MHVLWLVRSSSFYLHNARALRHVRALFSNNERRLRHECERIKKSKKRLIYYYVIKMIFIRDLFFIQNKINFGS